MRLLFMWINDESPFENFALNFDSEYRFSVKKIGYQFELGCVETGDKLPKDFFSLTSGNCGINVSVVVGKNASGKTSVARYLQAIRAFEDGTANFDYVMVYEKGDEWFVQWYDCHAQSEGYNVKLVRSHWPHPAVQVNVCEGGKCKKNEALWNFEYAYYSPHYTTENQFLVNSPSMTNLSTNGIMYGGFEEQMNRPYDWRDHQSIQKNYLAVEHRMGISALRKIPRGDNGLNLPQPQEVIISIHTVEYQENRRWLASQKKRLLNALEEESRKDGQSGIVSWLKVKIGAVEVLGESERYFSDHVHPKGSLVLRAFIALAYAYVRISGYFSERYNNLSVDYADYLLDVLSKCVLPFVYGKTDEGNVFDAHCKLVNALRCGVRLRSRRPGDIAEEDYPDELGERRALVRVFARLTRWCKERESENPLSAREAIHIKFDDVERFAEFFDQYVVAMNRFDFLSFSYLPVMSAGDMSFLSMYARLYDFLTVMQESRRLREYYEHSSFTFEMPGRLMRRSFSDEMVVFLDEAETTLHPERQREIVLNTIKFFNCVGLAKSVHIIFATHSAMILSDVPKGNVSFLRGGKEEGLQLHETFGGNVYDLYRLGFFMRNGAVGAFAAEKIKSVADGSAGSDECKFIVDHLGDGLVRMYLKQKCATRQAKE